ncbi:protein-disulfide isomerase [Amorphus orientalis]|uniref:Protein-disulfide isomerase n=1 Tax=Amorphus orientalis TaxID=649198 RepID=A0AAE4AQD1_9HYPH|nr:DsbA family protein [Amorphus orientalis]MDQ0313946.1 protein-disulfide isomerase [Amorphus orientalis]
MRLFRRSLVAAGASALMLVGLSGAPALAQNQDVTVDTDELMAEGPLPEMALGEEDAPVTIVEYASMTCPHCATFHEATYPDLKEKYIDTGKVRFVFREFPLDPLAAAGFMLARCAPEEQYFDMVDLLFEKQRQWAYSQDPVTELLNLSKQAGFTQESFEACLTNQELLDGVNEVKDRGARDFSVTSTPTFFVNGRMVRGARGIEEFSEIIDSELGS